MVDTGPVILGLCSGVGMLETAVRLVFPSARTAALAEWEGYAAAVQLARMADQSMEPAPVWYGDLTGFDAAPFHGVVDILVAGLPCQPYSLAGKQQGNTDQRSWGADGNGPIPQFLRIVAECLPALVFLENVPAWVVGGWFRPVGDELCRMGYELEAPIFLAASDVGATHERERVFVLAHLPGERGTRWPVSEPGRRLDTADADRRGAKVADAADGAAGFFGRREGREKLGCGRSDVADARHGAAGSRGYGTGRGQPPQRPATGSDDLADTGRGQLSEPGRGAQGRDGTRPAGAEMGNAQCAGLQGQPDRVDAGGRQEPSRSVGPAGRELGIFAPGPGDFDGWGCVVADGSFDGRAPAVKPGVRVLVDGVALVVDQSRADQLRCGGNGVVALQAAVALVESLRNISCKQC